LHKICKETNKCTWIYICNVITAHYILKPKCVCWFLWQFSESD